MYQRSEASPDHVCFHVFLLLAPTVAPVAYILASIWTLNYLDWTLQTASISHELIKTNTSKLIYCAIVDLFVIVKHVFLLPKKKKKKTKFSNINEIIQI